MQLGKELETTLQKTTEFDSKIKEQRKRCVCIVVADADLIFGRLLSKLAHTLFAGLRVRSCYIVFVLAPFEDQVSTILSNKCLHRASAVP